MKLINHTFTNIDSLEKFITNDLSSSQTLLIQIFSGTEDLFLLQTVLDFLKNILPHSKIIGSSTTGEISNGKILEKSITLSFSSFDHTNIEVNYFKTCDYSTGVEIAEKLIKEDTKVAIAFAESLKTDTESFLNGFSSLNKDVILCGGNAGDNYNFQKVYLIYEDIIYFNGVVIATLNSKILIALNNYILEWFPIGKEMTVTKAKDNILYEIDGVRTIDIYSKYLGEDIIKDIPASAIEYPFIKGEDDVEVARAVVGLGENGSMIYAGHFKVGDKIKFAIGNINSIKNRAVHLQNKIKQYPVEATFIYSCSVRKIFMQEHVQYEFEKVEEIAPTCGFFTYGEFFHSHSKQQLLNITTTTLSLSENNSLNIKDLKEKDIPLKTSTLEVLVHLVNSTQKELMEQKKIIQEQTIDELSGLENRISLLSKLKNLNNKHTLMLINLDNFSDINNFFGYEIGDTVLKLFAKKLKNKILNNTIYRISGDEFAVLYENQDFKENNLKEEITSIVNRLINSKMEISGLSTTISFTCGVAYGPNDILYKLCSMALKNSKNENKNLTFFEESNLQTNNIKKNIETITNIQDAIENNRIIPYYQGIVDNKTKQIVKYESLIRMISKDGKVISPYFFLEHAKKAKLYNTLTRILMKKTIEKFANNNFEFSINFTLQDILSNETRKILFNLLEKHKCANRLVIEIVESEGIDNFEEVISFIRDIKDIGCKIAIDDFGTGYSNFEYLIKLKADYLKIDGSLIKNIHKDKNIHTVVSTIVNFAKNLNMKVIAEFVEDEEIYDVLKKLDVDYSQGYFFSIPQEDLDL
jgi:diguanylate cyclase (GGDEF)-like protein